MYLRSTARRNKDGSEVRYLQLAHNVWDAAAKRSQVQVVCNFGREEPGTREALERLVDSVARHLEPGKARAVAATAWSSPGRGRWAAPGRWTRCGSGWAPARRCGRCSRAAGWTRQRSGCCSRWREPGAGPVA